MGKAFIDCTLHVSTHLHSNINQLTLGLALTSTFTDHAQGAIEGVNALLWERLPLIAPRTLARICTPTSTN
jgi:hypothetical protein